MIPSILTIVVLALAATDLAAAVGGPSVDPLGHGTALKARTNAEAIQKGEPLLKPRMVPCACLCASCTPALTLSAEPPSPSRPMAARVDHNYNRKRASPIVSRSTRINASGQTFTRRSRLTLSLLMLSPTHTIVQIRTEVIDLRPILHRYVTSKLNADIPCTLR